MVAFHVRLQATTYIIHHLRCGLLVLIYTPSLLRRCSYASAHVRMLKLLNLAARPLSVNLGSELVLSRRRTDAIIADETA